MIKNRGRLIKGVSTIEYSAVVALVVLAICAMSFYIQRAVSGHWRQTADSFGYGRQYDTKTDKNFVGPQLNLWGK